MTDPQSNNARTPNYTTEELYLVVRAQGKQISDLIRVQNEQDARIKKWEMFFGDKFSGVFAGEVGTVPDEKLNEIVLDEGLGAGFAALLKGEEISGNAPPTPLPPNPNEGKTGFEEIKDLKSLDPFDQ